MIHIRNNHRSSILLPGRSILLLGLSILMLSACGNGENQTDEIASYDVNGRYLSTDMQGHSISVIHETIPDVMDAMRMSLRVDDESVADELETGDPIRFRMVRTEQGWHIRDIESLPDDTELDLPPDLQNVGL